MNSSKATSNSERGGDIGLQDKTAKY